MFSSITAETIKMNDDPKQWMHGYLTKLKSESTIPEFKKRAAAREAFRPYAECVCKSCGELYMRSDAVRNQGICTAPINIPNASSSIMTVSSEPTPCGGMIVDNPDLIQQPISSVEEEADYECMSCGSQESKQAILANNKTCSDCGSKNFVKISLMETVKNNTIVANAARGNPVVDVEHEKGKIYAYYGYGEGDDRIDVCVLAQGKFTEHDFVYFDVNDGDPQAVVITEQINPEAKIDFVKAKYAVNQECQCQWAHDDSQVAEEEIVSVSDSTGRELQVGDKLSWRLPGGPCAGVVSGFNSTGALVDLTKHPSFGVSRNDQPLDTITASQEDINEHSVIVI